MRKHANVIFCLFFIASITLILVKCKKDEIVIVYSKIQTVGTSNTTSMSTDVEGFIEELTTATHSVYGICWDTVKDPTIYIQKSLASGAAKVGSFKITIGGLKPSKTYHTRAFVIDNKKYIYGLDVSFTTSSANLPVVSTTSVSGITSKYAVSGGDVTTEGDKPVVAKGVCYDTVSSPTILKNKTMDGWGTGSYTSYLDNLKPGKTYYIKAYAVSEFGVSYGSEVTFTTNAKLFTFHEDFTDNTNDWYTGSDSISSYAVTGGEYVCSYQKSGFLTWTYLNFPDFLTIANSKDFEIDASINIQPYNSSASTTGMVAGILWDVSASNFKYFWIKKNTTTGTSPTSDYYYSVGSYDGSYTTWKDVTYFSGSDFNKISIKKANGNYYFFINDEQVFRQTYSDISYEGVAFSIQDATLHADYFYIDQKGEKKSALTDLIMMVPDSKGKREFVKSFSNH